MRRFGLFAAFLVTTVAGVLAQEEDLRPFIQLTRGERVIRVVQNAPSAEGGEFVLNVRCEEEVRSSTVYAPEPYEVETFVNDMHITSRIVLDNRPGGRQEQAVLEFFDGTLEMSDEGCPQNIQPSEEAKVTIVEGRSTVDGSALRYDNATGIGNLEGPVTLLREAEEGSEALSARAGAMEFNVDEDRTLLRDNVVVESGGRVSEADEFEYDEAAGLAILRGSPASSRQGDDVVRGEVIEYDLVTNDVVVVGNVQGTLQFER